jgi:hypothetical protein
MAAHEGAKFKQFGCPGPLTVVKFNSKTYIITINTSVILSVWEVIFLCGAKHIIGDLEGFFEGAKTFLTRKLS